MFLRYSNDDFEVYVHCASLDAQFRAALVRLHAVVEGHPQVWCEVADVLQPGEGRACRFSKKISELPKVRKLKVRVRAQWTELVQLPSARDFWKECAAHFRCRWQLKDWRTVTPNSNGWFLFS